MVGVPVVSQIRIHAENTFDRENGPSASIRIEPVFVLALFAAGDVFLMCQEINGVKFAMADTTSSSDHTYSFQPFSYQSSSSLKIDFWLEYTFGSASFIPSIRVMNHRRPFWLN